jgi:CRP/FNR family transcriptional regulator
MTERMTLIEKTVFLKSLDMLSSVPTEALAQLAGHAEEVHAERGEVLFHEGDDDKGAFIVVEGSVELQKAGTVVRKLKPGSAHGEFFIESGGKHQFTGTAREDTYLLNLTHDEVIQAVLDAPAFGLAMLRVHARQLNSSAQRVVELEAKVQRLTAALEQAGIAVPEP